MDVHYASEPDMMHLHAMVEQILCGAVALSAISLHFAIPVPIGAGHNKERIGCQVVILVVFRLMLTQQLLRQFRDGTDLPI